MLKAHAMRRSWKTALAYLIVGGWSLFAVLMILWIIIASLKNTRSLFGSPWTLPSAPAFQNYVKVWIANRFDDYFLNSILVVSASVLVLLLVAVPAAYVLSRGKFLGRTA